MAFEGSFKDEEKIRELASCCDMLTVPSNHLPAACVREGGVSIPKCCSVPHIRLFEKFDTSTEENMDQTLAMKIQEPGLN